MGSGDRACPCAQVDRPGLAEAEADRAPGQHQSGAVPARDDAADLGRREPGPGRCCSGPPGGAARLAFDCLVDLGDDLDPPLAFWQHLDRAAVRCGSTALLKPHLTANDLSRRPLAAASEQDRPPTRRTFPVGALADASRTPKSCPPTPRGGTNRHLLVRRLGQESAEAWRSPLSACCVLLRGGEAG
ncbi:hypothetical protein AV521_31440 [Streptomyces sp. IMTB 2501]|nr:hypothetical protein AV521_31440 [Streptomyces sp. IMTB 2501]